MKFKYLGTHISGYGDVETEVRNKSMKAIRTTACLNNTIWTNKYLRIEAKTRSYDASVRPVMTYTAETQINMVKTKRMLEKH